MLTARAGKRYLDGEFIAKPRRAAKCRGFQFVFAGYPQRHERTDELQEHVGHAAGPRQGDRDAVELDQQLLGIAFDQAGGPPIEAVATTPASRMPVIPPMP
jgi:hypothetical protein